MSFFKNPFKKELTEEQIKTDKLGEDVVELLRINKDFVNNNYSDSDITLGIRDYGDFSARIYFENCKLQSIVFSFEKDTKKFDGFKDEYTHAPEKIVELFYHLFIGYRRQFDLRTNESIKNRLFYVPDFVRHLESDFVNNKYIPFEEFFEGNTTKENITVPKSGSVSTDPLA